MVCSHDSRSQSSSVVVVVVVVVVVAEAAQMVPGTHAHEGTESGRKREKRERGRWDIS